ncbi:hypothetical protein CFR79_14835 [Komagataeibacter saccharivorans]|uniref:ABC-three component system protein n=1 Tax=Komagataeibacter saccharivorans TaxID=265959 RepID=UPI000D7C66E9|nr:ABC-three component system protein [Komagataeibacter saccharivorans]PYD49412.1 hypothetical protein CFR79_14835 [Komagataeibacter saccharivorans]GBQ38529.1 hypothetical protein AA0614_1377 [Komagataeibacter saccharivorans NRIC 0614]
MAKAVLPFADWIDCARDPKESNQQRLYFLGTFDRRITFYSQQVRALRLAHALDATNAIAPGDTIAVVGAGAAGVTIAMAFALMGHDVTLYDPADNVLHLQSGSERLLHPHIYEWPRVGSLDDQAGLPILDWTAGSGADVCAALQLSFGSALGRLSDKLRFANRHRLERLERHNGDWRLTLKHEGADVCRIKQHVVLCIGFGAERKCGGVIPTDYWKQNAIGTNADEPEAPAKYLVSGNGDGALTELLRLLITNFEHVEFTRTFLGMFSGNTLREAADRSFAGTAVGDDLEASFQQHLLPLLEVHGILDRLAHLLRRDRHVTVNSSGPLYATAKASQLNQCMVFALLETAKRENVPVVRSKGHLKSVEPAAGGGMTAVGIADGTNPVTTVFKHVIARHGPEKAARYMAADAFFVVHENYMKALLKDHPDFADPPELAAGTYDRFSLLAIDALCDPANRVSALASFRQQQTTIHLEIDAAANVVVERGNVRLSEIADQAELLPEQMTVHLDLAPASLAIAKDLVRLSRASNGRVRLQTPSAHQGEWLKLSDQITSTITAPSRYRSHELHVPALAVAIDACLGRLLHGRLKQVFQSGNCPTIGDIDATLLSRISTTWADWQATLEGNETLREHVFRLLAHVDTANPGSWSGDHSLLNKLASAMFMMLATHHGRPLTISATERGNMTFDTDAIALGTGCELIGGRLLADAWTEAQQWGVDALIISSSAEIEIAPAPAGTVMNGGSPSKGFSEARQVRPAIIQNDSQWRRRLRGDFASWQAAVAAEFDAFRQRQDEQYSKVAQ